MYKSVQLVDRTQSLFFVGSTMVNLITIRSVLNAIRCLYHCIIDTLFSEVLIYTHYMLF